MTERHTISSVLGQRVATDADCTFLVTDSAQITYGELADATALVATRLTRHGIAKGSRVGLLMPNGIAWAVLAFAVMRIGAVLVPLSTLLRPPELEAQLKIAALECLLLTPGFRGRDY